VRKCSPLTFCPGKYTPHFHVDSRRNISVLIAFLLGAGALLAFSGVWSAGFVNYDDPAYVSANQIVQGGLTTENVRWAFTTFHYRNWHPLTWLSYMLDVELFGLSARGLHVVNLLLHIGNTLLIFTLLRRANTTPWPGAIVAALFGLHPLHVESVAWISERKDVLSAFFSLLSIWAYTAYTGRRSIGWYLVSLLLFAFALMSKAMAVTVPFLLLLVDLWPLRRLDSSSPPKPKGFGRLVFEKLPFFALAAAAAYAAVLAQGDAMVTTAHLGLVHRLENTIVSYARYLGKTFWPSDLAVFYPHPIGGWPTPVIVLSALVIVAITVFAIRARTRRPYLFVGWFWFIGTLVPVIGLVQVGSQSIADRYMYVPSIGLFIAIVWAARDLANAFRISRMALSLSTAAVLLVCGFFTIRQVSVWKDSLSLFSHAERVTPLNIVTLNNLVAELLARGKTAEADERIDTAIRSFPGEYPTWWHAANRAQRQGRLDEAIAHYQTALRLRPNEPQLNFLLAMALQQQDKPEAIRYYRETIRLEPESATALNNLAWLLVTHPDAGLRNGPEAVQFAERACQLAQWQHPYFLGTLAAAYAEVGRFDDAIATANKALALAEKHQEASLRQQILDALVAYKNHQPWRTPTR